jgi:hypothetical protein
MLVTRGVLKDDTSLLAPAGAARGRMGMLSLSLSASASLQLPPTPVTRQQAPEEVSPRRTEAYPPQAPEKLQHEVANGQAQQGHIHSHVQGDDAARGARACAGPDSQMDDMSIAVAAVLRENAKEKAVACLALLSRYLHKAIQSSEAK